MKEYKYIFGPVNSRRFGVSLGIDLSPDKKSCNFDCLYCELQKDTPIDKIKNEPNVENIIEEVKDFLSKNRFPDVITITANGEPTLYSQLKTLVEKLNKIKNKSKLLILSNASTIYKKEIRDILVDLDIVKLSLDAAIPDVFKKVDRPLPSISIEKIIDGIGKFRKVFSNTLIIEILLVKNINDSKENLEKLAHILKEIKPDRVDIGTVDRPPAYRVKPLTNNELLKAAEYFKGLNVNIVYSHESNPVKYYFSEKDIINTLKRRPLTLKDVELLFDEKSKKVFFELLKNNIIKEQKIGNVSFYKV